MSKDWPLCYNGTESCEPQMNAIFTPPGRGINRVSHYCTVLAHFRVPWFFHCFWIYGYDLCKVTFMLVSLLPNSWVHFFLFLGLLVLLKTFPHSWVVDLNFYWHNPCHRDLIYPLGVVHSVLERFVLWSDGKICR